MHRFVTKEHRSTTELVMPLASNERCGSFLLMYEGVVRPSPTQPSSSSAQYCRTIVVSVAPAVIMPASERTRHARSKIARCIGTWRAALAEPEGVGVS